MNARVKMALLALVITLVLGGVIFRVTGWFSGSSIGSATFISKPELPRTRTISINLVGDILPARAIELSMRSKGYDYPFGAMGSMLGDADLTFANLESPLIGDAESGRTTPGGTTVFRGDINFAAALKRAGIDIVSLANNHMKDQGQRGIQSTLETLNAAGVAHVGAGLDLANARALRIMEIHSSSSPHERPIRVGFLAYNDEDVVPPSYHATESQSGTHIMDVVELKEDILAARGQVDLLIVSMHSGTEYVTAKPNDRQTTFAHAAIDAGADMVVGHHPHVLQPSELYKGKYIYYSLGNFVFDQPWPDTKQSVLVHMQVDLELSTSTDAWEVRQYLPDIMPLQIVRFQPQPTTSLEQARAVFQVLGLPYSVLNLGKQSIMVEKATSTAARERGLSGRFGLSAHTGMLFVFDQPGRHGFWMQDMRFPIDLYWFDANLRLTGSRLGVTPETYPDVLYPQGDNVRDDLYVLETAQGQLDPATLTLDLTGVLTESHTYDKK